MDVFKFIALTVLLASSCGLSTQTPVEQADSADDAEESTTVAVVMETTTSNAVTAPLKSPTLRVQCATARGVIGACAARQDCQHSTAAIDLTLFATHGYVKPCSMEEVCCPSDALIQITETNQQAVDGNTFEFDEDD